MSSHPGAKREHFWRRCCKKLTELNDTNSGRHHSIRRWKNVRDPSVSLKPVAIEYRAAAAMMPKPCERAIQPRHLVQSPARAKRTVSGAVTAPALGSDLTKSSLSPQTFTTAETSIDRQERCYDCDAPRPTLDPRSSYSFRTNMKSGRFHRKLPDDSEPSFTFGFTARSESNSSFFTSSASDSSSLSSRDSDRDGDRDSDRDGGAKESPSLDNMVKTFDWYATSAFKKLETSVLSLLNLRAEYVGVESSADLTASPFSEFCEYGLTPCTGAATKWEQDIDEAIYGHHAKCFI